MLWQILVSLVIGALVGWLAGKIMKSKNGLLVNIILGILGGALGGWLGSLIGIGGGWVTSILLAIGGSCLIIWILRLIKKKYVFVSSHPGKAALSHGAFPASLGRESGANRAKTERIIENCLSHGAFLPENRLFG
ncbi:MAG: GlsB/YeaQ/YmgE family stress response membrane protein [Clostridia bacterium]|nr:GlsB/YeaQ/YmgE family stress response membrane protein [Clostridia bacterium]